MTGVPACPGFRFAGLACGIKRGLRPDLALVAAADDVPTAAVFTQSPLPGAPVTLSRKRVAAGLARAIIVNSGVANAFTGERGLADAEAMGHYAARALGCDEKRVLVASTGELGVPLPIERIVEATPRLVAAARPDALEDFTHAIMTTDRVEKRALALLPLGKKTQARVLGVAKGSTLVAPNLATVLVFVVTDAAVQKGFLRKALEEEVGALNQLSVDGEESPNDAAFLMASGAARQAQPIDGGDRGKALRGALRDVLIELGRQIVRDGGGAQHLVTIELEGAASAASAEATVRRLGRSVPFRAALFGARPAWPEALLALAAAGIDTRKVDLGVGEVELVRAGAGLGPEAERAARGVMRRGEYTLRLHLHAGRAAARHVTCDLGVEYAKLQLER